MYEFLAALCIGIAAIILIYVAIKEVRAGNDWTAAASGAAALFFVVLILGRIGQ